MNYSDLRELILIKADRPQVIKYDETRYSGGSMAYGKCSSVSPEFDSEHPGARFLEDCTLQLEVCRSLLALADGLPANLDRRAIVHLIEITPSAWEAHGALQSELIFPLLRRRNEGKSELLSVLDHLEQQHTEIAGVNDELVEQLGFVLSGEEIDVEPLGYLIRNAAERRREHVEWEHALLNCLFPRALALVERQQFAEWLAANPWPFDAIPKSSARRTEA